MGYLPLDLCRADENDHDAIVGLIEAAAQWLRETKDTDSVVPAVAQRRGPEQPDPP